MQPDSRTNTCLIIEKDKKLTEMNPRSRSIFLIIIFPMLIAATCFASTGLDNKIRFNHLTTNDGLSQNSVRAIIQDRRGFIWLGTWEGLNRFDGSEFVTYKNNPNDPNSLPNNTVSAIYEDSSGFLWIGTVNGGLSRFDPAAETFKNFRHNPNNPESIGDNIILDIAEDSEGVIWIGTYSGGVDRYDPSTDSFRHYKYDPENRDGVGKGEVWSVLIDRRNRLWVACSEGGLNLYDRDRDRFIKFIPGSNRVGGISSKNIMSVFEDRGGVIWVGTKDQGLSRMVMDDDAAPDPGTTEFVNYRSAPGNAYGPSSNLIRSICEDRYGNLWLAGWSMMNGLDKFNRETGKFTNFRHDPTDPESISSDDVIALFHDDSGAVWVGTFNGGLNLFDSSPPDFLHVYRELNREGLREGIVRSVFASKRKSGGYNRIWIGTHKGLKELRLGRVNHDDSRFFRIIHHPFPTEGAGKFTGSVEAICEDRRGDVWLSRNLGGHEGGLYRYRPVTGEWTLFQNDTEDDDSLADNMVLSLHEDKKGRLWIGTDDGLCLYQPETETFDTYRYEAGKKSGLRKFSIRTIAEDRGGRLWLGSWYSGLTMFNPDKGLFRNYSHDPEDKTSLSNNAVYSIHEDAEGVLWVGSQTGLNRYDASTGSFRRYLEEDGLPSSNIRGIQSDLKGGLWVGSTLGLSRFDKKTGEFKNFDRLDGLQGDEFCEASCAAGLDGFLFFGGVSGLNIFQPEKITGNSYLPPVYITEMRVFNQRVKPGDDSFLKKPIWLTDSITLPYSHNNFSFMLSALTYLDHEKTKYKYRLEGFEENWNETCHIERSASYTNVPPGEYTFEVVATAGDGVWTNKVKELKITLKPPFWRTHLAWLLYIAAAFGMIAGFIHVRTRSQALALARKEKELDQQKIMTDELRRINGLKDEFLTNTSHELRTPLHGIIGITESLLNGIAGTLPPKAEANLELVVKSGGRLLNLINDIMDLSRLRYDEISLDRRPVNVYSAVDSVLAMIQPIVGEKGIRLINSVEENSPMVWADENRLQQILYNLVGNAVKFTDKGVVAVSAGKPAAGGADSDFVQITVTDTGIGIPGDKLDKIFEYFERVETPDSAGRGGTGLGLAITRKLVEIHGGEIKVESVPGRGSNFNFTMPVFRNCSMPPYPEPQKSMSDFLPDPQVDSDININKKDWLENGDGRDADGGRPRIIVVDDDKVNLQVVSNHLHLHDYSVSLCTNGREALTAITYGTLPDLVLLDAMMPKLSGYDVCRKLREKYSMTELPILMLTAKDRPRDMASGFSAGANDYLVKPFNADELIIRVNNLVNLKRSARDLTEQRRLLKGIIDHSSALIDVLDLNGRYMLVNKALRGRLNVDEEHIIGKRPSDFFNEEQLEELLRKDSEAVNTLSAVQWTYSLSFNGREAHFLMIRFPLLSADGKPYATAGVATDISRSRELEKQLHHSQKMEAIGRLAGGVAHDFNNLLTAVGGYCQLLMQEIPEAVDSYNKLDQIRKATERGSKLARKLLTFSRSAETKREAARLNEVVSDTFKLIERVIGEDIRVVTDLEPALDFVMVDAVQLEQVIMNLIVNSRDAMPDGGLLSISTENAAINGDSEVYAKFNIPDGDYVLLKVADTGSGMTDDVLQHIFEPFYTTKPEGKGTGLGLATVYGIIRQNAGHIHVDSRPGAGTIFYIFFQALRDVECIKRKKKQRKTVVAEKGGESGTLLVVEDDNSVRELLREGLELYGYDVLTASNGPDARRIYSDEKERIRMLISDIIMPGENGVELYEKLRAAAPDIRVLFLSGYSGAELREKGVLTEAPFLAKPFDLSELIIKVREVLAA